MKLSTIMRGVALIGAVSVSPAMAEEVKISGSNAFYDSLIKGREAAIQKSAGVTIKIMRDESAHGLQDLVSGKADMAMLSAPLELVVEHQNKKKPGSLDPSKMKVHFITLSHVAFVVHPSNPVKKLTMFKIRDIMSGKIKNWSELGGPSKPIQIVVEDESSGLRSEVEQLLLKDKTIAGNLKEVQSAKHVIAEVAKNPLAFGFVDQNEETKSVVEIQTRFHLSEPFALVTLGPPSPKAKKVIEALRDLARGDGDKKADKNKSAKAHETIAAIQPDPGVSPVLWLELPASIVAQMPDRPPRLTL